MLTVLEHGVQSAALLPPPSVPYLSHPFLPLTSAPPHFIHNPTPALPIYPPASSSSSPPSSFPTIPSPSISPFPLSSSPSIFLAYTHPSTLSSASSSISPYLTLSIPFLSPPPSPQSPFPSSSSPLCAPSHPLLTYTAIPSSPSLYPYLNNYHPEDFITRNVQCFRAWDMV